MHVTPNLARSPRSLPRVYSTARGLGGSILWHFFLFLILPPESLSWKHFGQEEYSLNECILPTPKSCGTRRKPKLDHASMVNRPGDSSEHFYNPQVITNY